MTHWKAFFYLLPCILVLSLHSSATSIVVLRSPEHIVIGADTLFLHTNPDEKTYRCKLHEVETNSLGSVIVALAGLVDDSGRGTAFDSVEIAEEAIHSAQTLDQVASNFETLALPKYTNTLTRIRQLQPDTWAARIGREGHYANPLQVIFANVSNGVPKWIIVIFTIMPGYDTGSVRLTTRELACPGNACYSGPRALGEVALIGKAWVVGSPSLQYDPDEVDIVRKLVELEIKGSPKTVGGRVNIVVLDADGVHWVQAF